MWKWLGGLATGLLLSVLISLIQNNTPLFKSRVRVLNDEPPVGRTLDSKVTDKGITSLSEWKVKVKNYGFKSGGIHKIVIVPSDLRSTPKIEIISLYRSEIEPLDTVWATIKLRVSIDLDSYCKDEDKGYQLELYDEYDAYMGHLLVHFFYIPKGENPDEYLKKGEDPDEYNNKNSRHHICRPLNGFIPTSEQEKLAGKDHSPLIPNTLNPSG